MSDRRTAYGGSASSHSPIVVATRKADARVRWHDAPHQHAFVSAEVMTNNE